jgi:hypothetical protein
VQINKTGMTYWHETDELFSFSGAIFSGQTVDKNCFGFHSSSWLKKNNKLVKNCFGFHSSSWLKKNNKTGCKILVLET